MSRPETHNDDGNELRAQVIQLALDHPSSDRHVLSRTHIFYAPWMEPFGAKGFGNFPDEAFAQYRTSIEQLVRSASMRDLQLWREKFEEFVLNARRVREEAEIATSVSRQIGMYTGRRLHDSVQSAAEESHHRSLNAFCEALLAQGTDRLEQLEAQQGRASVDAVLGRFRSATTDADVAKSWSITVSSHLKARLVVFARKHEVKVPLVARAIFATWPELR